MNNFCKLGTQINYNGKYGKTLTVFDKTGLTDDEKAKRVFDAIDKFIQENPEKTIAPNLVITREWKAEYNYRGICRLVSNFSVII